MNNLHLASPPLTAFDVLAYDPGGTTGWARAVLSKDVIDYDREVELRDIVLTTGEFSGEHHQEIYEQIGKIFHSSDTWNAASLEVVSEPFHYRQNVVQDRFRGKVELISAEYIGVIRLACAQLGLTYYDRFTPGEAKAYITDKKLELLGWLQLPIT